MALISGSSTIDWSGVSLDPIDVEQNFDEMFNRLDQVVTEIENGQFFFNAAPTSTRVSVTLFSGGIVSYAGSDLLSNSAVITSFSYSNPSTGDVVKFTGSIDGVGNDVYTSVTLGVPALHATIIGNIVVDPLGNASGSITQLKMTVESTDVIIKGSLVLSGEEISGTVTQITVLSGANTIFMSGLSVPYSALDSVITVNDLFSVVGNQMSGNDTIAYTNSSGTGMTFYGGAGNDRITISGPNGDRLNGGDGNDTLSGGLGQDTVNGDAGDDRITMLVTAGNVDTIDAGNGTDTLVLSGVVPGDHLAVVDLSSTTDQVVSIGGVADALTQINFENLNASGIGSAVTVTGNAGVNILIGSKGNDNLDGGAGNDAMIGGAGNDIYTVDNAGDVVSEALNAGTDKVFSSIDYTLTANVDNLELTGIADLHGTGNALANIIIGNSSVNILSGGAGNDTLISGLGQDTVTGGSGNDRIVMQVTAGDVDFAEGGVGSDTLALDGVVDGDGVVVVDLSSLTDQVTRIGTVNSESLVQKNFENLDATGLIGSVIATGSAGANLMIGSTGTDQLTGGAGADILVGGAGDDILNSGDGNNVILIGNAADHGVGEVIDGGAGADVIRFTSTTDGETLLLSPDVMGVESVVISTATGLTTGMTALNVDASALNSGLSITGNAGANALTGTDFNDVLKGGGGNDTLNGGAGTNTLLGGTGNDSYFVNASTDVVSEGLAAGSDTVLASINYTLGANLENLTLTGAAINGTGNGLANILTGNDGDNVLIGNAGNDTLIGGLGEDTVTGGAGNDQIVMLITSGDVDLADGGAGSDTLALDGVVDGDGVVVVDLSSLTDQVTRIGTVNSESLVQKNIENLDASGLGGSVIVTGSAGANLMIGSTGNDTLTGLAGNDTLNGGAGDDVMDGGAGNDIYVVDTLNDTVTELLAGATGGVDLVLSAAASFTLGANLENLTLIGTDNIDGTGNGLNNILTGNSGNNSLDGGTGSDIMMGGLGDDTYTVDVASDVVSEALNAGTDTVVASLNYTLGANIENLTLAALAGNINGTGNALTNILIGNSGNNLLSGLVGNDTLDGGDGNDTLNGGLGQDSVFGGVGNDQITMLVTAGNVDTIDAGTDNDTLVLSGVVPGDHMVVVDLASTTDQVVSIGGIVDAFTQINFENLDASGIGSAATVTGSAGDNSIIGSNGNDTLDGGAGVDTLNGGAGDDTLIFDDLDQRIDGGGGSDTLLFNGSGQTLDLAALANNRITGIEIINLTGSGNNALILNVGDLQDLSDTSNALRVDGNPGDTVNAGLGWSFGINVTVGNQVYVQYTQGNAVLQVDSDIALTIGNAVILSALSGTDGFRLSDAALINPSEGRSVSSAGDVNSDGFDDLIVGVNDASPNGDWSGQSYVVFGKSSGFASNIDLTSLNGTNGFKLSGEAADDRSGGDVSSAGDVNGDGFADVIIGASLADSSGSDSGASYVVFGKASSFAANIDLSSLNGANGFKLSGTVAGDRLGAVSEAGDVNGDGYDDLIVGASYADPNGSASGASYVIFGKSGGFASDIDLSILNGTNGFKLSGIAAEDSSGVSASSAGDVNGDGFADLVIGAVGADLNIPSPGSLTLTGQSYVVFGNAGGFAANISLSDLNGTNGFKLNGANGDESGSSVSAAGDVNGDGFADVIIGTTPVGTSVAASYVVFGKSAGFAATIELSLLDGTNGFKLIGGNEVSSHSVSSAGDVNGDGFDDLVVGASRADANGLDSGQSYVIYGKGSGFGANLVLTQMTESDGFVINTSAFGIGGGFEFNYSGSSVSGAGDVNGDGFDDLLVGAQGASFEIFGGNFTRSVDFLGTSGNDILTGNGSANILIGGLGNDTLDGGAGDDRLAGGLGNDTYQVNRGNGRDIISENDSTPVNSDALLYGATINPLDLVISRQANDLRIAIHGSTDQITIQNWYSAPTTAQVETIQAGNGQALLSTQVDQLIQAMAGFTQQTGLTWDQDIVQQPQAVQTVLAASWQ